MTRNWRILGSLAAIAIVVAIFAPIAMADKGGTPNRSPVPACTNSNGNAPNKNPHCQTSSSYPPPPPSCKPDNDANGDLHQAAKHNGDHDCDADNQPASAGFTTTRHGTSGGVTVGMALGFLLLLTMAGILLRRHRMKSLGS